MVKQISDNEIYLLIKYIKSVLWRVVKRLSYIEDARCLKVNEAYDCMDSDSPSKEMPTVKSHFFPFTSFFFYFAVQELLSHSAILKLHT